MENMQESFMYKDLTIVKAEEGYAWVLQKPTGGELLLCLEDIYLWSFVLKSFKTEFMALLKLGNDVSLYELALKTQVDTGLLNIDYQYKISIEDVIFKLADDKQSVCLSDSIGMIYLDLDILENLPDVIISVLNLKNDYVDLALKVGCKYILVNETCKNLELGSVFELVRVINRCDNSLMYLMHNDLNDIVVNQDDLKEHFKYIGRR